MITPIISIYPIFFSGLQPIYEKKNVTAKAPEKLPSNPIGSRIVFQLPTIMFQGRHVKLREGKELQRVFRELQFEQDNLALFFFGGLDIITPNAIETSTLLMEILHHQGCVKPCK